MSIENQIAVNADEPEQYSATEMLNIMIASPCDDIILSITCECCFNELTCYMSRDALEQAALDSILDNPNAIKELYIKTIQSLME